ncbi:hypothetical protein QYM36_002949, partial [Artemia franciscana]
IRRSVFGEKISYASLETNLLVVSEGSQNITKLYSLQDVLNLNQFMDKDEHLGYIVDVEKLPEPLLIVKSAQCKLMFDGSLPVLAFCSEVDRWS